MPCKNTTTELQIFLSPDETLLDYAYQKITCSKTVGGSPYKAECQNRTIQDILSFDFNMLTHKLSISSGEEQFFLYLEWEALRRALRLYKGLDPIKNGSRYQILSIEEGIDLIQINVICKPPETMPKVIPCCSAKAHA